MNVLSPLLLPALVVFIVAIYFQAIQWRQSVGESKKIDEIINSFFVDANLGSVMLDHFDRLVAPPLDNIRRHSNSALVIGIAGTMGIFLIEIIFFSNNQDILEFGLSLVFEGTILALISSLIGMICHLLILSSVSSSAQRKVVEKEKEILDRLNIGKQYQDSAEVFTSPIISGEYSSAVQSEIKVIYESIARAVGGMKDSQTDFKEFLNETIQHSNGERDSMKEIQKSMNQAVEGMKDSQTDFKEFLNETIQHSNGERDSMKEIQKSMNQAVGGMKDSQTDFKEFLNETIQHSNGERDSMKEIQKSMNQAVEGMKDSQTDFKEFLNETIQHSNGERDSMKEIQKSMNQAVGGMKDSQTEQQKSSETIENNVKSLTQELVSLPSELRTSLEASQFFDKAAKEYLARLQEVFKEHEDKLTETIVKNQLEVERWLGDQIDKAIHEAINNLQEPIKENIVKPLEEMRKKLSVTTDKMPSAANEVSNSLKKSADKLSLIPDKLELVVEKIAEIVRSTTNEALKPASNQMRDFVDTVHDTHSRLENIIQGLVNLIQSLIEEIEGRVQ